MDAPTIIKMEQEIEREMLIDAGEIEPEETGYYQDEEPEQPTQPQKVTIDFKSLDEMVSYSLCIRISEIKKFKIAYLFK